METSTDEDGVLAAKIAAEIIVMALAVFEVSAGAIEEPETNVGAIEEPEKTPAGAIEPEETAAGASEEPEKTDEVLEDAAPMDVEQPDAAPMEVGPPAAPPSKEKRSKAKVVLDPLDKCAKILGTLMKRTDAKAWFNSPVPPDTEGYFDLIEKPIDYGTIKATLEAGDYGDADTFAEAVRLLVSNAVKYSPEAENDCHKAALANLAAFERVWVKEGLATDGGAAAEAAEAKVKPASRKRGRSS